MSWVGATNQKLQIRVEYDAELSDNSETLILNERHITRQHSRNHISSAMHIHMHFKYHLHPQVNATMRRCNFIMIHRFEATIGHPRVWFVGVESAKQKAPYKLTQATR